MTCIDRYRSDLVANTNRNLGIILNAVDEEAIHRFRVSVKRLTALYRFLGEVNPEIRARQLLRPLRRLSKDIARVRDCHITLNLLTEIGYADRSGGLRDALHARIEIDYRHFAERSRDLGLERVRLPTLGALGFSEAGLLRAKPAVLESLRAQITPGDGGLDAEAWHRRRILLKRYHHSLDAFQHCRGQRADERDIAKMKMLEQLLGDWHDRVVAVEIIESLDPAVDDRSGLVAELNEQAHNLLASARIYLARFVRGLPGE